MKFWITFESVLLYWKYESKASPFVFFASVRGNRTLYASIRTCIQQHHIGYHFNWRGNQSGEKSEIYLRIQSKKRTLLNEYFHGEGRWKENTDQLKLWEFCSCHSRDETHFQSDNWKWIFNAMKATQHT